MILVVVSAGSTGQTVSSADALFEHLCVTVLQQSHLCPVPLETRPVSWQYDHALHLYPAPDLIVLADSAAASQFSFKQTEFVNPVSAGCITNLVCLTVLAVARSQLTGPSHKVIWMSTSLVPCALQGSFATGAFAAYNPYEREVELSEIPTSDVP